MNNHALTELTQAYEDALVAMRNFKEKCVGVVTESATYSTTPKLLNLIPNITEVYREYHDKLVEDFLDENEFY